MKENQQPERESIIGRLLEFVKEHPPFSLIEPAEQKQLCDQASIAYFPGGTSIFQEGDALHTSLYMIRKGQVNIISKTGELIDRCGEGEIFGSRAFMSTETYQASAVADSEALCILFPVEVWRGLFLQNPRLIEYFFGDFSSGLALRKRKLSQINLQLKNLTQKEDSVLPGTQTAKINTQVLSCHSEMPIKEAAKMMSEKRYGSILIQNEKNHPIGIITNSDLRNQIATGNHGIEEPVHAIMNHPVFTATANHDLDFYLLEMLSKGVQHIVITEDGTDRTEIKGVLSHHDILVQQGSSTSTLIKELRRSHDIPDVARRFDAHLKELAKKEMPVADMARKAAYFNKELIKVILNDILKAYPECKAEDFCLIALGSAAREEQVIRTDFDSGIIYSNTSTTTAATYREIADKLFEQLLFCGYHSDKAGIQANNPEWILSLEDWTKKIRSWIIEPTEDALLHSTIFFDMMPYFGEESLAVSLQETIYSTYKGNRYFINFLLQNALQNPPPLGFFKNFLLEKSGEHAHNFDIKARAMMPLADAARLLALEHNTLYPSNTIQRYERLIKARSNDAEVLDDAATAYDIFLNLRVQSGFRNKDDGRYLNPEQLNSLEKQVLKSAFAPVSAIQHLLKNKG